MLRAPEVESRLLVGDVIAGKYRIDCIAGEGGMGIVYEAEHLVLGQRIAIKVRLPSATSSADAVERFCLEARAAARIENEHVVRVMDAGSLPTGEPYLVMEYLDGCDLKLLLERRGGLPVSEAVDYALQALEGLAHAHASGVLHRDLKPANLFLATSADGRRIIKVLDFGISTPITTPKDGRLTGPSRILGSPVYMSPEQLRNETLGARSDLWSLGVVLYELVCGRAPFENEVFGALVSSILAGELVPLSSRAPDVSQALSDVVARCLEKSAAARWRDAGELARALAPHGSGAWSGAVERIERVIARAGRGAGPRSSGLLRRFESYELALQDLETEAEPASDFENEATPASVASTLPPMGAEAVADRVTRLPARPASIPAKKSALRILLIDDSELALAVHDHWLSSAGFDVRTTASVGEFEILLEGWAPHLVLMDVTMPEVSGDVLCRQVKERLGGAVPVVLLSGLPNEVLETLARKGRADAFLSKDTVGPQLVEYVRNICAMTYSPEDLP
jgi:serine/threonine-protein kinase